MGKNAIESVRAFENLLDSSGARGGHLVPGNPEISETFLDSFAMAEGLMVPKRPAHPRKAFLDGNLVRRKLPLRSKEYCIWDTQLPGFGLRVRPSGAHVWFVRLRQRGKHRRVSLGKTQDVEAVAARASARRLLADVALDGLPKRVVVKSTPTLTDYVEIYWKDIARYWKPSTQKRNLDAWKRDLGPVFGSIRVADRSRSDVTRWRDDCAGDLEARFNRALPILASLLKYAEQLHLRPKGSTLVEACHAIAAHNVNASSLYSNIAVWERLCGTWKETIQREVAITRLLLYTGARISEIKDLRWDWVRPPHLLLPDGKTGAKTI